MSEWIIKDTQLKDMTLLVNMIEGESEEQIKKWGIQNRHIFEWAMFSAEEFGEFIQAVNELVYRKGTKQHVVREAIQTITLLAKVIDGLVESEGP